MGFFGKIIREVSRPFKQAGREFERVVSKTVEETKRIDKQFKSSIGLGTPEFPSLPPLPKPAAPPATRISGGASDEIRRRQRGRVSGRKDTIVTGELSPTKVGKKTLLGRQSR